MRIRTRLPALVASAIVFSAGSAQAGDFMDTRLTWTFGDDDVLHSTGVAFPLSPNASIGDRPQYRMFFDNLNSRFSGRENLTHLVMYKRMPGFIKNLDTEAAMVLRIDLAQLSSNSGNLNTAFYDSGSYLRLFYATRRGNPEAGTADEGFDLTLFPLDTDRFRLGYLYDISWGGTNAYINQSVFPRIRGGAPGAKLQFQGNRFYVYGGFKTASIVQVEQVIMPGEETTNEADNVKIAQTNYGFLGGAGVDITDFLRIDLGAGYFQQGKQDLPDVLGERVYTYGGAGRLVIHHKMPVPKSVDFSLYRNDPNNPLVLFRPEQYDPGEFSWAITLEGDRLYQNLRDFNAPGTMSLQAAQAAAAQAVIKAGYLRASVTGIFRDLPFVVRNQPSFIPFQTLPEDAKTDSEIFFAAAADYYIPSLRLTPGLGGGVKFPSTFKSDQTDIGGGSISRTMVVREQGNISILPVGADAKPIVQARVSLKWDISDIMSAVVWGQLVHDNNATFVSTDESDGTITLRKFIDPDFVGFGTSVQARF